MPNILLVEDDEMNRDMMSRWLIRWGYKVTMAVNGEEAVNKVHRDKPDLVLMDLSLPKIDGWEATRRLKADVKTRQIPIIALTAHAMTGDRVKALVAGCDEYSAKPVDFKRLQKIIDALLQRMPQPDR